MSRQALRPWTELVKLHPDVEAGNLPEAVFAIDLGAIAERDPNVPVVNRHPEAFFRSPFPFTVGSCEARQITPLEAVAGLPCVQEQF